MIFVLGSNKYSFSAGVKDDMPFFAIGEANDRPKDEIYIGDDASNIIEKFSKDGVIVYFENQMAAENFHTLMALIFSRAVEVNDWPERGSKDAMQ